MEYTDEYVHINYVSSPANTAGVTEVVINHNNDRAPYALVEVISATIQSETDVNTTFVVMTEEIAVNVRNTANVGTSLALVDYVAPIDVAGGASFAYQLLGQGTKALYSNTRTLHFYFTNAAGGTILPADALITGYNVLLKISRPVVGSIQPSYREQIPL